MSSCGIIISVVLLGLVASVHSYVIDNCYTMCNPSYLYSMARIVFGEARGDIFEGQVAVAYTIVNRVAHDGYADSVNSVIETTHSGLHDYKTLDDHDHDRAWAAAERDISGEYIAAIKAAGAALCGCELNPTGGATDFCAHDPCISTIDNEYWLAVNKIKVGAHYFCCCVAPK